MANYNSTAVAALAAEDGAIVNKIEYRGNPQKIPFFFDNGTTGVNSGDTLTLTAKLPPDTVAVSVHYKTAGVGTGSTLQLSAGGTNITAAIDIGTAAVDETYLCFVAGEDTVDVGGEQIIATIGGADWDDGANDLWGYLEIVTNQ
jgi:hypothetical protein